MNIQITSRHSKVSQDTHDFIKAELENVEKFTDTITSAHVIIETEHEERTVEISAKVNGNTVVAKATAENLGKALDQAIEKLTRQLKKHNEKTKEHQSVPMGDAIDVLDPLEVDEYADDIENVRKK